MRTVVAPLVVKTDTRLHTFRQAKPESKRATSADGDRIVRIRFGIELLSKPFTQKDDVSHLIVESFYPAWRKADRQICKPESARCSLIGFWGSHTMYRDAPAFFPAGASEKNSVSFPGFP